MMQNQIPGKLFEYISYGKPIVNICKNENCSTLPYMASYPYALNLLEKPELLEPQAKQLEAYILAHHTHRVAHSDILRIYKACTPEYCATQMLSVFSSVAEKPCRGDFSPA